MYRWYLAFYAAIALVVPRILISGKKEITASRAGGRDSRGLHSNSPGVFSKLNFLPNGSRGTARLGDPGAFARPRKNFDQDREESQTKVIRELPRRGIARSYSCRVADESDIVNTFLVSRRAPRNLLIHGVTVAVDLTVFRSSSSDVTYRVSSLKVTPKTISAHMSEFTVRSLSTFHGAPITPRSVSITGKPPPIKRAWVLCAIFTPSDSSPEKRRVQFINFILRPAYNREMSNALNIAA